MKKIQYSNVLRLTLGFLSLSLVLIAPTSASASEKIVRPLATDKQSMNTGKTIVRSSEVRAVTSKPKSIVERLKPGEELQGALKRIASSHKLKAGVIVSAVGSLSTASLRFAGANESRQ